VRGGVVGAPAGPAAPPAAPADRGGHPADRRWGGAPSDGLASMTVVGRGLTQADARATAAYAMGAGARAWLEQLPGTEGFAVAADGTTWQTSGFARYQGRHGDGEGRAA
ncbi:FAD:protein FMN transferase, partial [Streptomyces sp. NPDC059017]